MRAFYIVFMATLICSCQPNSQDNKGSIGNTQIPLMEDSNIVNLGSEDNPVLVRLGYIGSLTLNGKVYNHIAAFEHNYLNQGYVDTLFYETAGRVDLSELLSNKNFKVEPFPGDATIKISLNDQDIILFNVLEFHDYDRKYNGTEYMGLPTVKRRDGHDVVSSDDVEINLTERSDGLYELKLLDAKLGERTLLYELGPNCELDKRTISYLDRSTGNLYFISKNCHLELVSPSDFARI